MELRAAKEWQLTPDEFDAKDPEVRAEMIAFLTVSNAVEAYHYEMSDKAAKSSSSDVAGPGIPQRRKRNAS